MAMITVRNLSDETYRALKARAADHGHSTEAEIRAILDDAVAPLDRVRLGSLLAGIVTPLGHVDLERDPTTSEPPAFD